MKKYFKWCCVIGLFLVLGGCNNDDINDLQGRVDQLEVEQKRQAELLENYGVLLEALQKQLSVNGINAVEGGYNIVFSNGEVMSITNGYTAIIVKGENGNWWIDGKDSEIAAGTTAPKITIDADGMWVLDGVTTIVAAGNAAIAGTHIISVLDLGDSLIFTLSNGTIQTVVKSSGALYILSEGSWGRGNSELSYYDMLTGTLTTGYFAEKNNGKALGDTGNDLLLYGSKLYCAVSGKSVEDGGGYVEVLDAKTGKSLKRIKIKGAGKVQMPRKLTAYEGKVYVSIYAGAVADVDTSTLKSSQYIGLTGGFSEGICAKDGKLYVCNSGNKEDGVGGKGTTLSVVNVATFVEEKTVTVPVNPNRIGVAPNGEIYLTTWGESSMTPHLHLFDPASGGLTKTFETGLASTFAFSDQYVYTVATNWSTYATELYRINLVTKEMTTFVEADDMPAYTMGYNIDVNPENGDVYMTKMDNEVFVFSSTGVLKQTFNTVAGNGSKVVYVTK